MRLTGLCQTVAALQCEVRLRYNFPHFLRTMNPLRLLAAFLLAAFLFAAFLLTVAAAHSADRPNVIFLLADDIGYADLSCYGAKHANTPNLDRLAAQGCRFTDAHSPASTCTPTRRAFGKLRLPSTPLSSGA